MELKVGTKVALVGVSFLPEGVLDSLSLDDLVFLHHDPNNEYDQFAVEATIAVSDDSGGWKPGTHIGYVPKELARRLTNPAFGGMFGAKWAARIVDFTEHRGERKGIRLEILPDGVVDIPPVTESAVVP